MAKKKAVKMAVPKKDIKKAEPQKATKKSPWAPLSGGFMVVSILGLIISAYIIKKYPSWGITFLIVFAVMFIASLISMKKAPIQGLK